MHSVRCENHKKREAKRESGGKWQEATVQKGVNGNSGIPFAFAQKIIKLKKIVSCNTKKFKGNF